MKEHEKAILDDDLKYIELCLNGDAEAFGMLVEKYQKRMFNISYRMIGDFEEACDSVQEAFIAAFRGLKGFRRRSRFSTWLFAIAINNARNRMKRLRSPRRSNYSLQDALSAENGTVTIDRASGGPSALEVLEKKKLQEKVQECLEELDNDFREVIILREMQEFTYNEISEMLGIPEGTVKSRLYRARDSVKNCLKKIVGEL